MTKQEWKAETHRTRKAQREAAKRWEQAHELFTDGGRLIAALRAQTSTSQQKAA